MIRQRIKSFKVRPDAQRDFDVHTQASMRDMVWTGTCRSWCKSKALASDFDNSGVPAQLT